MIWKLMVPPLSRKVAIFTNLGQGLSQIVGFFLFLYSTLRAGFSDKLLAVSNKKSSFVLVSGFWLLYFLNFAQMLFERLFFH